MKKFNTFNIESLAEKIFFIDNEDDILVALKECQGLHPKILGGGSNILLINNQSQPILKIETKGIEIIEEDKDAVTIKVAAGEVWHDFVLFCVAHEYYGIENLSLIPGTVGASPIQNIGAYGVEVKDVISQVRYYDIDEAVYKEVNNQQCRFGYRDSIFKNELKGKFIITSVVFTLSKIPKINISYGNIAQELQATNKSTYTIKDVSDAVIKIRSEKLPNPAEIGNSGSFFKNPVVSNEHFQAIQSAHNTVPHFVVEGGIKIPAAWLIEQCGWKGYRNRDYGVHAKQPLVLVNYADASGQEIYDLSSAIIASVQDKFSITLEREVQMWT